MFELFKPFEFGFFHMYFKTPLIKIPSVLKARWMIVSFVRYLGVVYVVSISEILWFYYIEYISSFSAFQNVNWLVKKLILCWFTLPILYSCTWLLNYYVQCFPANKEEFVVLYCKHVLYFPVNSPCLDAEEMLMIHLLFAKKEIYYILQYLLNIGHSNPDI